jgi:hypothetical protein
VPPVEYKCADKPGQQTLHRRNEYVGKGKQGVSLKPQLPGQASQQDDPELAEVKQERTQVPAGCVRKCATGENAFRSKKDERDTKYQIDKVHQPGSLVISAVYAQL